MATATTQTPIPCPQCGNTRVAIRENLPQSNPSVTITCATCKLSQIVDTVPVTTVTQEGS